MGSPTGNTLGAFSVAKAQTMTAHSRALAISAVLIYSAMAAACSPATPVRSDYVSVTQETLTPTDPIPVPTAETVLTIGGSVSKPNAGSTVIFDLGTLERMGLVRYTVHDPWLDEDVEFTGVLLADLLDTVGASPEAQMVHLVALDDYEVDVSVADARRWPILLATQANGKPMSVADKGPTRIVFPYDQYPEINPVKYEPLWIWQVESLEVR